MPIAPPPRPKQPILWIVIPIGIALAAIVSFLVIWQFLAPAERKTPVAYSDFITEVRAGRVEEIRIRDRELTFRVRSSSGRVVTKEAIGPVADQALVDSLKPDDPNLPPPKITFEK